MASPGRWEFATDGADSRRVSTAGAIAVAQGFFFFTFSITPIYYFI